MRNALLIRSAGWPVCPFRGHLNAKTCRCFRCAHWHGYGAEIAQQALKNSVIGVVVLPLAHVADIAFLPDFLCPSAGGRFDGIVESDRKQDDLSVSVAPWRAPVLFRAQPRRYQQSVSRERAATCRTRESPRRSPGASSRQSGDRAERTNTARPCSGDRRVVAQRIPGLYPSS